MIIWLGFIILISLTLLNFPFLWLGDLTPFSLIENIPLFLTYFFLSFVSYSVAIYYVRRNLVSLVNFYSKGAFYLNPLLIILIFAVLMRVSFLVSDPIPSLSDDIFRYWWDAKVQYYGFNPFHYSPKDFPFDELKDEYYYRINHPQIPAVYPPFTQFVFLITYSIYPSILSFKLMALFFDLLTIAILILWLKEKKLSLYYILIYAWNPLVIVEFCHGGHFDSLVVFLMALICYLYESSKKNWSLIVLAFLILTKYLGLIFLPLYYKKVSWKHFLFFLGILFCFFLAYYDEQIFSALINYGRYWKYNSFLYQNLYLLLDDEQLPKFILGLLFLVLYVWQWRKTQQKDELWGQSFFFILALFLLFTSVLHPWYVVPIVSLQVVYFNRSWIMFTGLIALSYITLIDYYQTGIWREKFEVILIEYLPFYALLLRDYLKKKLEQLKFTEIGILLFLGGFGTFSLILARSFCV